MNCNGICEDIEPRGIMIFHPGIWKDRMDAAYVKYLSNGMKTHTVLVAIIN